MEERDSGDKAYKLAQLRVKRLASPHVREGGDYRCISSFANGDWDSEHVVPWTKSACNLDAELVVLGQDWASEEFLERGFDQTVARLGYDPRLPTNRNLFALLERHMGMTFAQTFATDVFPFIKKGGMSNRIHRMTLVEAAREYALPQINIIRPLMVICLGRSTTFLAIATALSDSNRSLDRVLTKKDELPLGPLHFCGTEIYGVMHTGSWGNLPKFRPRRESEWAFLGARLPELRRSRSFAQD